MQPYTERSGNPEDQPDANVRANFDPSAGANVRMTVQEAAAALGITVEAVRGRMHRGKYGREKGEDGRVYVVLTSDQLMNGWERSAPAEANVGTDVSDQSQEHSGEQLANVRERDSDWSLEGGELVEELRDHVAFLRAELEARNEEIRRREEEHREEARRKDTIIAQLAQRIPELSVASSQESTEPRDVPETVSKDSDRGEVPEPQEPAQRRSWLYRFFFGP